MDFKIAPDAETPSLLLSGSPGKFIGLATRLPWKSPDWCYDYKGVLVCVYTLDTFHHLHGFQPTLVLDGYCNSFISLLTLLSHLPPSNFCSQQSQRSIRSYCSSVQTVQMASYHSDWKWVFEMIFICPSLISYITFLLPSLCVNHTGPLLSMEIQGLHTYSRQGRMFVMVTAGP